MNNYKLLSITALFTTFLLSSCSTNKTAFHKRKYQPWFLKQKAKHIVQAQPVETTTDINKRKVEPITKVEATEIEQPHALIANQDEQSTIDKRTLRKEIRKSLTGDAMSVRFGGLTWRQPVAKSPMANTISTAPDQSNHDPSEAEVAILLLVILAFLLPPLAVLLVDGIGVSFLLSIIFTLLGWLPGIIYALLVIFGVI